VNRADLVRDLGLTLDKVRADRDRLMNLGVDLRFRRGTRHDFRIVIDTQRAVRPLRKYARKNPDLDGLCGVFPEPDPTKVTQPLDITGTDPTKDRPPKSRPHKGGRRSEPKNPTKGKQRHRKTGKKKRTKAGSAPCTDASVPPRVIATSYKGGKAGAVPRPCSATLRKDGAGRAATAGSRSAIADPDEMQRLLTLARPTGSDLTRRRTLVRALSARFNLAYRKAWRAAYGKRPAQDYSKAFEEVAVWCAVEGIEPAEYIKVSSETAKRFANWKLIPASVLASVKTRDRYVEEVATRKRARSKHAGFSYDYDLDVGDLKRRLVGAKLPGARELDEKTLHRIERLCKHGLDGRLPVMSRKLEPFVRWALDHVYRKRR